MRKRAAFRTGDQALVRRINLSLVMRVLRTHAPISRAVLAQATGLNKSTVSDLIAELLGLGFVRELGARPGGAGRPGQLLSLNPQAGCIVGCEIGVGQIELLLTDFAPAPIWQARERVAPGTGREELLARVRDLMGQAVARGYALGYSPLGVAVGIPGIVDHRSGAVLFAPNLQWRDVPLRELLDQAALGAPVFVDNEANMAALGEHFFGAAQGFDEVLYISVGSGLGGGIIHNGHICRGARGGAAEFGHMLLSVDGELCSCGNRGCWETLADQQALLRSVGCLLAQGRPSRLAGPPERLDVPTVIAAARAGDAVALEAFGQIARWLGVGITSLLHALNPALVVIGGSLSTASDIMLPVVSAEIRRRALHSNYATVPVVPATHSADTCVRGAIATVYQYVLAQPNVAAQGMEVMP